MRKPKERTRESVRARPAGCKNAVLSSISLNPASRTMRKASGITASRGRFNDCAYCWNMYPSTASIDFKGDAETADATVARKTRRVMGKFSSYPVARVLQFWPCWGQMCPSAEAYHDAVEFDRAPPPKLVRGDRVF